MQYAVLTTTLQLALLVRVQKVLSWDYHDEFHIPESSTIRLFAFVKLHKFDSLTSFLENT